MRLLVYTIFSSLLAASAVYHAYSLHKQFYPVCIYLSRHSASFMCLMNVLLLGILYVGKAIQHVFIGPLRVIEVEHLYERAWFSVSETCLAMTIFRNDFDTPFVIYFSLLLLIKCFHWLAADRVDFMEQTPMLPRYFHIRIPVLILTLLLVDSFFLYDAYTSVQKTGPSISLLFCFEYAILLASCVVTICRFILHSIDHSYPDRSWEEKSVYLFYLDLLFDFAKLICYISFFVAVLQEYGLPIHIIRDLYITTRSFIGRIKDMIQYRRVTMNMNERYPTVTAEELNELNDKTCIICREDMAVADNPKRLSCGHIFHFRCLRSWLERQQTCPTCRRNILEDSPAVNPAGAPAMPAHQLQNLPPAVLAQLNQQQLNAAQNNAAADHNETGEHGDIGANTEQAATTTLNAINIPYTPVLRLIPLFTAAQAQNPSSVVDRVNVTGIPKDLGNNISEVELKRLQETSVEGLRARLRLLESIRLKTDSMTTEILAQLKIVEDMHDAQEIENGGGSSSNGN